jgi:hypothetical protein
MPAIAAGLLPLAFSAGGDGGRNRLNFRQRKVICGRKRLSNN